MMYSCVDVAADLLETANCDGVAGANPFVDAKTLHASSATAYFDIIAMMMIVLLQLFTTGCLRPPSTTTLCLLSLCNALQKHSMMHEKDVKKKDLQNNFHEAAAVICAMYDIETK